MEANTLVVVTGYGSIKPKPWKKAYLNVNEEVAAQRFTVDYPTARDVSVVTVQFRDELIIGSNGDISSTWTAYLH
jgi:hypothetical protein